MINYKKILCPVDFSEGCKEALNHAIDIAEKFGGSLTLIHVIPHVSTFSMTSYYDVDDKTDLANLISTIPANIPHNSEIVKNDDVDDGIAEYARDNKFDIIVMGTHGHSGIGRVLLGSTAEETIRKAPCPVLVVRKT